MVSPSSVAARGGLRHLISRPRLNDGEKREAAFQLVQHFTHFAEICGCKATSNRAHVRRAVFHATLDMDLAPLIETHLSGDVSAIESVIRMECPVMVPDRTMINQRVPESAPKRIIFAAKTLRKHYSLAETTTCRSCSKRSRCKFFKTPAEDCMTPGVWHLARVIFGMSQYARGYLQQPEAYPFYFAPANLASAHKLIDAMAELISEDRAVPLYSDLHTADEESAREIYLRDARKKLDKKKAEMEEKLLSMPPWMRETLRPVPSKDMTRRQRKLAEGSELDAKHEQPTSTSRLFGNDEEDLWREESAMPGQLADVAGLQWSQDYSAVAETSFANHRRGADLEDAPLVNIDGISDMPVVKRFEHLPPKREKKQVSPFNSIVGGHTNGIYHVEGERWSRIDLDEVAGTEVDLDAEVEKLAATHGGYTIVDLLDHETFQNVPQEVLQYVSLSPGALMGVQQYGSPPSPRFLSPRIVDELWQREDTHQDELPFLDRVPFDSGVGRSGGSLPPTRLPRDKLLKNAEPIVAPPQRGTRKRVKETTEFALDATVEEPTGDVIQLDYDQSSRGNDAYGTQPDVFTADEALITKAFGERGRIMGAWESTHTANPEVKTMEALPRHQDDSEDQRFVAWTSRRPPLVSVLEPRVDFKRLSNPDNLENVHATNSEVDVIPRQRAPLPHDEKFASTFRRSLLQADNEDEDALGDAAPGIDINAIKSGAARQQPEKVMGLEQDNDYIFGGDLKFPKFSKRKPQSSLQSTAHGELSDSRASKATRQLPPRFGRLRQAKVEDLSDLLRKETSAGPPGRWPDPSSTKSDVALEKRVLTAEDARKHENAAIAMQKLLSKQVKQSMQQKYPSSKGQRER